MRVSARQAVGNGDRFISSLSIFSYRLSVATACTRGLPRYARNDGIRVKGIVPLWVWATPTNSIAQVKQPLGCAKYAFGVMQAPLAIHERFTFNSPLTVAQATVFIQKLVYIVHGGFEFDWLGVVFFVRLNNQRTIKPDVF